MKVVLVNPPVRLPRAFAHYPMFSSLGLLYNAAWLRHQGFEVSVVDAFTLTPNLNLREDGGDFRHLGAEIDDLGEAVRQKAGEDGRDTALVVGITMFSDMNRLSENLVPAVVERLRRDFPNSHLGLADLFVCGMNYFPYDVPGILRTIPGADWLLIGEGEPTLPELFGRLTAGRSLKGMPRLGFRDADGGIHFNPAAPLSIDDVDSLPAPAFDLINMDNYFSTQADAIGLDLVHEYHVVERQIPLMTSRSCPFRCNFCTNQVLALPWRGHSVEYLRNTLNTLRETYQVDRFLFLDDNINVREERFRDLVLALAEEKIPWDAVNGYRADHLDRDMIRAIKASGNTKVTVSAESGDPELLKQVIRKGLKLSKVTKLAKECLEERLPLQVHYIVGVPGETKAQINTTLEYSTMLFEMAGAWPLLQHAIPFPGTALFRECEEKGYFVKPPFEVSGDILEVESIIQTPEFSPGEVVRMKRNAQHLHVAIQSLTFVDVGGPCSIECLAGHNHGERKKAPTVSHEEIHATLDRALFLGGRELFLGGGEPTLREDLPEIVAKARELGFVRCSLVSNGHGLSDEAAADRLLTGIDHVVLGLHGPDADIHDRVTGIPGSFMSTLKALQLLRRRDNVSFELNTVVTTENLRALPAMARLAAYYGATGIHLQYPTPDSLAMERGMVPHWRQARRWLKRAVSEAQPGFVSVQGVPLCILRKPRGALRPSPHWVNARTRKHKAKHPVCRECVGYILCGGFYRPEHEETYGMLEAAGLASPQPSEREGVPEAG